MSIPKDIQYLYAATSADEIMRKSKPVQVRLANIGKNEHCNVARYNHWWNKTASLVLTVKHYKTTKIFLITSNN